MWCFQASAEVCSQCGLKLSKNLQCASFPSLRRAGAGSRLASRRRKHVDGITLQLPSIQYVREARVSGLLRRRALLEKKEARNFDFDAGNTGKTLHQTQPTTTALNLTQRWNPTTREFVRPCWPPAPPGKEKPGTAGGAGEHKVGRSGSLIHPPSILLFISQLSLVRVPVSTAGRCGRTRPDRVSTSVRSSSASKSFSAGAAARDSGER